jgi:hypothetical protein
MFELLKKWFGKKEGTNAADVDPLAVALLTPDVGGDNTKTLDNVSDQSPAVDDDFDADDADFDV